MHPVLPLAPASSLPPPLPSPPLLFLVPGGGPHSRRTCTHGPWESARPPPIVPDFPRAGQGTSGPVLCSLFQRWDMVPSFARSSSSSARLAAQGSDDPHIGSPPTAGRGRWGVRGVLGGVELEGEVEARVVFGACVRRGLPWQPPVGPDPPRRGLPGQPPAGWRLLGQPPQGPPPRRRRGRERRSLAGLRAAEPAPAPAPAPSPQGRRWSARSGA
eukprot:gene6917-biopygen7455